MPVVPGEMHRVFTADIVCDVRIEPDRVFLRQLSAEDLKVKGPVRSGDDPVYLRGQLFELLYELRSPAPHPLWPLRGGPDLRARMQLL